jgi:hypothetical protein
MDSSRWPCGTLYPQKVGNHFADKGRSLGRYSSLADTDHGGFFFFLNFSNGSNFSKYSERRQTGMSNITCKFWEIYLDRKSYTKSYWNRSYKLFRGNLSSSTRGSICPGVSVMWATPPLQPLPPRSCDVWRSLLPNLLRIWSVSNFIQHNHHVLQPRI